MSTLSPFVYWAQDETNIFLKVDLKDVKDPQVLCDGRNVHFEARGSGAGGLDNYSFDLNLFSDVKINDVTTKLNDNSVNVKLVKVENSWWARLILTQQKPSWLKVDFDRFQSEDDTLEQQMNDIRNDYPDLYNMLQKQEVGYIREDFKKVYLTVYNIFMLVGFIYIASVLCTEYMKDGPNFLPHTYDTVGPAMHIMQLFQLLEVMHSLFGYVRGGVLMPLLQNFGKCFILFAMLEGEPRIQKMPVVFYLFLTWSAVEVIRYSYYITQIIKKEQPLLTWLRYSVWIVLYPIGFTCEAVIVFRNLIFVRASRKWSVEMPNFLNFTFDFPAFLSIYMLLLMIPAMYALMRHMYKTRVKKLGGKEPFLKIFKKIN